VGGSVIVEFKVLFRHIVRELRKTMQNTRKAGFLVEKVGMTGAANVPCKLNSSPAFVRSRGRQKVTVL